MPNQEKKVSIITPCYNGEAYAERFFENILDQTYGNIELIFVNDGSTDRTEDIAKSYISKFEESGKELIYIYQENSGQSEAINKGLAIFDGDYLMWTDSDDILDKENVRKKVEYLENNPKCGFVMCYGREVLESDPYVKTNDLRRVPPRGEDNLFKDLILEKNVVFTPGVYMVRREELLKAIPSKHIRNSRVGQNWQMLLPIAYNCKCGYLKEELFSYVIRDDSHSRTEKSLEDTVVKLHNHDELLNMILEDMGLGDYEYTEMLKDKLVRKEFDNGYLYKNKKYLKEKYLELKKMGKVTKRDTLIYLAGLFPPVDVFYYCFKQAKKKYRSL